MDEEALSGGSELLSCQGLTKRFGALTAINNLSLSLQAGEILGIGGPNGAGKTTLFELLSGFTKPDAGRVVFLGLDVTGRSPDQLARAGMLRMYQAATCFSSMTVLENVLVASAHVSGRSITRFASAMKDAAWEAVKWAGLKDRANQVAGPLSVLDRKRLMLASAMVMQPKLILLDEPVGGLNPLEIQAMADLVRSANAAGVSIVLIEHVMRFMIELAGRILILHHGEQLFCGPGKQLLQDSRVREVYLGESAVAEFGGVPA